MGFKTDKTSTEGKGHLPEPCEGEGQSSLSPLPLELNRIPSRFPSLLVICLCLSLSLASCTRFSKGNLPTLYPTEYLPTLVAMTVEARRQGTLAAASSMEPSLTQPTLSPANPGLVSTITPFSPPATASPAEPTASSLPLQDTASPALPPTITPTLDLPDAAIQIREPGAQSRLVSPFTVRAYVKPGSGGRVRLELIGEDGQLLVRKVLIFDTSLPRVNLNEEVDFEVNAVAEAARLQISTYDDFDRPLALDSVEVILLSMGEADITPPGPTGEKIIIQEPQANKLIQGGMLVVSGMIRTSGEQPLLIELLASDGRIVGYRQAALVVDPSGGFVTFMTEVPYKVDAATWVRMTIKENSSSRIPGVVYLTSSELLLSP